MNINIILVKNLFNFILLLLPMLILVNKDIHHFYLAPNPDLYSFIP